MISWDFKNELNSICVLSVNGVGYYSDFLQSSISRHLNTSEITHRVEIIINTGKHTVNLVFKLGNFLLF